jgi:cytochrome P450
VLKGLAELPRIPWRPEFAADPVPHLVRGFQTHGPVFGLDVPDADPGMIFMIGPEANERVLTDVETFTWGPVYKPVRKAWGEHNFIAMDGPRHDLWRKLIQPGVTGAALMRHLDMMREVIGRRIQQWTDRVVDVHDPLRHTIFEIAARAFCGITDAGLMRDFTTEYENMMGTAVDPMVEASFAMDPDAGSRVRKLLYSLIEEARTRSEQRNVLEVLAAATDEHGQHFDIDEVASQALVLLLAGHETTASVSSFLLWLLGTHADIAEKLRDEIESMPDETSVQVLRRSPYLNDVLMEAERLHPPLPITGRAASRDVEFGGITLPAGTFIQLSPAATHMLPHVFADPERFDPSRFAEPRSEHRRTRFSLIGFSAGPRVCLGMPFARVEMAELLVQLYRRFRFEAESAETPRIHRGQTAVPGSPIEISFRTRTPDLVS